MRDIPGTFPLLLTRTAAESCPARTRLFAVGWYGGSAGLAVKCWHLLAALASPALGLMQYQLPPLLNQQYLLVLLPSWPCPTPLTCPTTQLRRSPKRLVLVDAVDTNATDACASRQKAACGATLDVHVPRGHRGQPASTMRSWWRLRGRHLRGHHGRHFWEVCFVVRQRVGLFRSSRGALRSYGLRRWPVEVSLTFSVSCYSHTSHRGVCAPLRLSIDLFPLWWYVFSWTLGVATFVALLTTLIRHFGTLIRDTCEKRKRDPISKTLLNQDLMAMDCGENTSRTPGLSADRCSQSLCTCCAQFILHSHISSRAMRSSRSEQAQEYSMQVFLSLEKEYHLHDIDSPAFVRDTDHIFAIPFLHVTPVVVIVLTKSRIVVRRYIYHWRRSTAGWRFHESPLLHRSWAQEDRARQDSGQPAKFDNWWQGLHGGNRCGTIGRGTPINDIFSLRVGRKHCARFGPRWRANTENAGITAVFTGTTRKWRTS